MSLCGKLGSEFEINAPAHKVYKVFKDLCFHLPTISPKFIQGVQLHGGDWDNHAHGSIKIWNYTTVDGKAEVLKEQVQFDDEKLIITKIGLEGDAFNCYETFNPIYQVVPKGPENSLVILTLEYKKLKHDSPYPYKYIDTITRMIKDIKSHLK